MRLVKFCVVNSFYISNKLFSSPSVFFLIFSSLRGPGQQEVCNDYVTPKLAPFWEKITLLLCITIFVCFLWLVVLPP